HGPVQLPEVRLAQLLRPVVSPAVAQPRFAVGAEPLEDPIHRGVMDLQLELPPCWGSPLLPGEEAGLWRGLPPTETANLAISPPTTAFWQSSPRKVPEPDRLSGPRLSDMGCLNSASMLHNSIQYQCHTMPHGSWM